MRILVTGAAGFIGSHLVDRLLNDGHEVLGVDDLSTGQLANLHAARQQPTFELLELDIVTAELHRVVAAYHPSLIMHLAAQMDVRKSVDDPLYDTRINVDGTVNVLEACARNHVEKIVFASSGGTIYGEPEAVPVTEAHALVPRSPYGAAKAAGEIYLVAYAHLHGVRWTSLALGNVYGPRQNPHGEAGVVAIFARGLVQGRTNVIYGDGTSVRDYVYVDDVVEAFIQAIGPDLDGNRYNVGTGKGTSVADLHRALADILAAPASATLVAARPGELDRITLDSRAIRAATNWRPRVSLTEGLKATVDWVREAYVQGGL